MIRAFSLMNLSILVGGVWFVYFDNFWSKSHS